MSIPVAARATPFDYISVDDPIAEELRILDMLSSKPLGDRFRLPHLLSLPLQPIELQGRGAPLGNVDRIRRLSVMRLERHLGRDRAPWFELLAMSVIRCYTQRHGMGTLTFCVF